MYIQKVDKSGKYMPEMGEKNVLNKPEDVNIYKLFEKKDEAKINTKLKKEKIDENMF